MLVAFSMNSCLNYANGCELRNTIRGLAAIAWDGIENNNEPLGSGRLFLGCSHLDNTNFAILFTN